MLFMCGGGHSVHLSVSFPVPCSVSRYDSVALHPSPGVLELVFLSALFDHVTWRRSSSLSLLGFARKTSTSSKFSFPFPAFPFRPFVFPLSIICSCESGRLSRVIPILFPCPVN